MFERYAVYATPQGRLADVGAAWLGWDLARGKQVPHPVLNGVDVAALTKNPRKYGLHGTIKPPFYLAKGHTVAELQGSLAALCARLSPVRLDGLEVRHLAGFIALTPVGDTVALASMAAQVVSELDPFRAPPSEAEVARRRQTPLSPQQEKHLARWGYPYVMDQFRFHMTLTGKEPDADMHLDAIAAHFAPVLPTPFVVDGLTLAGQDRAGMFHEVHRYAFAG